MIKILYVEDEPFLAKIVKETLESRDFQVVHADDGEDAIQIFQDTNPDLCVLDIMLPKKNGYQVANHIRKIQKNIPILFLSAKNQTEDLVKGFESGGNDYIRKPFSMEELIVRIHNLLNLTNSKNQTSYSVQISQTVSYNPDSLSIEINGTSTSLSHKENEILSLLCNHKNEVIDRKKILMAVWNDDSYFNSRTLDVYIRKLRKLLSVDPNIQIITLKGIGYRFSVPD